MKIGGGLRLFAAAIAAASTVAAQPADDPIGALLDAPPVVAPPATTEAPDEVGTTGPNAQAPESVPAAPVAAPPAVQAAAPVPPPEPPAAPAPMLASAPEPAPAPAPYVPLPPRPQPYAPPPVAATSPAPYTPFPIQTAPPSQPAPYYAPPPPTAPAALPPPRVTRRQSATPVHVDELDASPEAAPTPSESNYEQRLRSSFASAQGLQGPMDGGWILSAPGDGDLYALELVERSSGVLEGAWRDLRRPGAIGASGFLDDIQRYGGQLTLRFNANGETAVATLAAGMDGRWSGEMAAGKRARPVVLRRN